LFKSFQPEAENGNLSKKPELFRSNVEHWDESNLLASHTS
jgi:hypothetical protein